MTFQHCRRILIVSLFMCLMPVTLLIGQPKPIDSVNNLFTVWVKLSLIGYSQSEIETALDHVDTKQLDRVKHRVRLNVIKNLKRMNIDYEIDNSTTPIDLRLVIEKIRTEVRFAGLENDRHLRNMIRREFGVPLRRI